MKIGVKLPTSGPFASAEHIRRTIEECDRLGYDSVWVHDHVHRTASNVKSHFVAGSLKAWDTVEEPVTPDVFESVTALFYAAALTTNMHLGTSIIVLPLRNPVWLAKYFACLDQYSGGRTILGIGAGGGPYIAEELSAIGHPELVKRRGAVIDEYVEIMRRVWEDDVVDYDGEFLQVQGAEIFPKPVQKRLPILYGGYGDRARERITRHLDGWLPMFLSPDELREERAVLAEHAGAIGRDPSELLVVSEHWLSIGEDHDAATERADTVHRELRDYVRRTHPETAAKTAARKAGRPDVSLVGSPDAILELLVQYEEAGADHIVLRVLADDFEEMIEELNMFKERVLERLPGRTPITV